MSKRKVFTFVGCFLLVFVALILFLSTIHDESVIVLGGKPLVVDIAETEYLQGKGLGGRSGISDEEGMFFIFNVPDKYDFWMKDMLFPIDILWIDQNFKIIHIEKSISPASYPAVFSPPGPAKYVLEVSAGLSERLHVKIGDTVKFFRK